MSVQLEFVGHACFRLWENGRPVLVTDPLRYEHLGLSDPGTRFEADTVIASSLTDEAHANVALVKGRPRARCGPRQDRGDERAIGAHGPGPRRPQAPRARAHGQRPVRVPAWRVHMGDVGPNQLPLDQLAPFTGHCDVLFALTGEQLTPTHEELDSMIDFLKPKWLVPMHYNIPPVSFKMSKIDDLHRAPGR